MVAFFFLAAISDVFYEILVGLGALRWPPGGGLGRFLGLRRGPKRHRLAVKSGRGGLDGGNKRSYNRQDSSEEGCADMYQHPLDAFSCFVWHEDWISIVFFVGGRVLRSASVSSSCFPVVISLL